MIKRSNLILILEKGSIIIFNIRFLYFVQSFDIFPWLKIKGSTIENQIIQFYANFVHKNLNKLKLLNLVQSFDIFPQLRIKTSTIEDRKIKYDHEFIKRIENYILELRFILKASIYQYKALDIWTFK